MAVIWGSPPPPSAPSSPPDAAPPAAPLRWALAGRAAASPLQSQAGGRELLWFGGTSTSHGESAPVSGGICVVPRRAVLRPSLHVLCQAAGRVPCQGSYVQKRGLQKSAGQARPRGWHATRLNPAPAESSWPSRARLRPPLGCRRACGSQLALVVGKAAWAGPTRLTIAAMRSSSSGAGGSLLGPAPGSQGPPQGGAPAARRESAPARPPVGRAGTSLSTGASCSPPTHTAVLLSPADRASRSRCGKTACLPSQECQRHGSRFMASAAAPARQPAKQVTHAPGDPVHGW